MATIVISCPYCCSEQTIHFGKTTNGYPRYRCRACGKTFSDAPERGHTEDFKERVLAAYQERMSMRGIARTFHISRNTLSAWLKEKGGS
jgi:transposase-like protein